MFPSGMSTFLRFANLYGQPDEVSGSSPIPTLTRPPSHYAQDLPTTANFQFPQIQQQQPQEQPDILEAFKQSVLNPPQRTHMTYPKNTLAGWQKGLELLAEDSPTKKNRVYVNGKPYQQAKVYTDPATGEKKYINNAKDPSFMDQVLKTMPAAMSPATDILNQPYQDAVSDWELKNKGLQAANTAESNAALAQQRMANAGVIPQRENRLQQQGDAALLIRLKDADTRAKLAELHDLSDSEKMQLLQEGKIELQDIKDSAAMERLVKSGQIRDAQIDAQGKIRFSAIHRQGEEARETAGVRGEEARKTKGTPSANAGITGQLPTQQKVALQNKVTKITNQHPEWKGWISIDPTTGFPEIEPPSTWKPGKPDKATYDKIYNEIYGDEKQTAAPIEPPKTQPNQAKPPQNQTNKIPVPPPTTPGVQPIIQHSESTGQYRISYDGGKTWRPYNPNGKQ